MKTLFKTLLITIVLLVGVGAAFSVHTDNAQAQTIGDVVSPASTSTEGEPGETESIASKIIGWVLRPFAWTFQFAGTIFLNFSSMILGKAIDYSLGPTIGTLSGIQVGWQVMRDFANLFFIFVILYIAIQTILQLSDRNTKQMLVRVIVVALLINFSAFFAKVVIDASNILAIEFYNTILTSDAPGTPGSSTCGASNCGIGERFSSALGINTTAERDEDVEGSLAISLLYFLNGLTYFVLGAVFIKGAFYFIARSVIFVFLIMFSPLAFLSAAIPNGKVSGYLDKWWEKLLSYSLLAPAYMIIIYLVLQVARGISNQTFDVFNYLIIITLIYLGSDMAFKFADSTGVKIAKFTGGVAVGAATGGAALAGRQLIGRAGMYTKDNETLKRLANDDKGWRGRLARNTINYSDKATKSSFNLNKTALGAQFAKSVDADVPDWAQSGDGGFKKTGGIERRVSDVMTLGLGTTRGFGKHSVGSEEREEIYKRANDLYSKDPQARKAFIQQKLGGYVSAEKEDGGRVGLKDYFNEDKSKETKAEKKSISTGIRKKENEKLIKNNIAAAQGGNAAARKEVVGAIQQLGPKLVAELDEKMLTDIAEYLSRADLSAIHKRHIDGEYTDGDTTLSTIGSKLQKTQDIREDTQEARDLNSQREKAREYLASEEGRRDLFSYRIPASAYTQTKKYKNAETNTQNAKARQQVEEEALQQLQTAFNDVQDAEGRHLVEDINSLTKEIREHADFADQSSGDNSPWTHEHTTRLNDLTGKLRTKRREFEKRLERSAVTPGQQAEVERLRTVRANLDMSVSTAPREAADLDAQIQALERGR